MQIIKGKINSAQKVVVYGPEGIGKTTFASMLPNPIFSDTEGSTKKLDVARLPKPSSWTMLIEQAKYVKANPSICSTYVCDTADWAEMLCIEHICSKAKANVNGIEDFGYGKGYVYLAEEFGRWLNLLEELVELGINIVITAHAKMRKFEQPNEMGAYDRWEMKLQKQTAPLLKEWADTVLFANYKTYVVNVDNQGAQKGKNKAQGGSRVMYTQHHPCWDAKNRDGLPSEIPFDFKEIAHCIPDAINKEVSSKSEPIEKVTYWHHQESGVVFTENSSNKLPDDGSVEISKDEYDRLKTQYEQTIHQEPIINKSSLEEPQDLPKCAPPRQIVPDGVPKALADLMAENLVTETEIQKAVSSKGYYPEDTPIKNYDASFISGVLIAAWSQVFNMIKELREYNTMPFNEGGNKI